MACMDLTLLVPVSLPLLLLFVLHKLLNARATNNCSLSPPPGPRPWPILGNIHQLSGHMPHVKFSELSKIYGPLISLKLGAQLVIVGSSPSVTEEILKQNDRILSARFVPGVTPMEMHELRRMAIAFSPECGEGWKSLRTLCKADLFGGKALESTAWLREKKAMEMVEVIKSKEGSVVDIGEMAFATVLNVLGNALMSKDLITFGDGLVEDGTMKNLTREIMEVSVAPNVSDLYPFLRRLDLQGRRRKAKGLITKMSDVWLAVARERRNGREGREGMRPQDFLDVVIANDFTDEAITQLFMELFTAGTDTTSSTVEWAMAELVKNPDPMSRLREELDRVIGPHAPNENQLPELVYLQACVKETLRLHPPVPLLLPRRAPEPCTVMNHVVHKEAQVLINVWAIGRDPTVWEDPLRFRPERFLESALDFKGNHFEFMPFGGGRRMCPGLPMAAKQVPLILATLINLFDWSAPEGTGFEGIDMKEKWGLTLEKAQPLFLIPKARR